MGAVVAETTGAGDRVKLPRRLALFFAKVVACYLVGVFAWNGLGADRLYLSVFRETHTEFFRMMHRAGARWVVVLSAPESNHEGFDSNLNVLNTINQTMGTQGLRVQYRAFAPTWLLVSLIVSTPVPWTRRAIALVLGFLLQSAWIALGLVLLVWKAYATPGELALYEWGDAARALLNFVTEIVATSTATQFAVPVLIWALVTFRAGDAATLLGIAAPPRADATPPEPSPRRESQARKRRR